MKEARETVAAFVLHARARASTAARNDVGSIVRFCLGNVKRESMNPEAER